MKTEFKVSPELMHRSGLRTILPHFLYSHNAIMTLRRLHTYDLLLQGLNLSHYVPYR